MGSGEKPSAAVPRHIGIIMDGNGRWATRRRLRRTRGHTKGIEAAKRIVLEAIEQNIGYLSLYAFSTENWRRTEEEVSFILALVAKNLRSQYSFYRDNNVCVRHSGNLEGLPSQVRDEIHRVTEETRNNTAITVNLAVNYGGRDEIARAANRALQHKLGSCGEPLDEAALLLTEEDIQHHLDLPDLPDPDLIIRTGGHRRISNFLIWESAYAELYFSNRFWPEWTGKDLRKAIHDFGLRKRNFGGTG
ncbi:undecaprenyl diphosphate synthase [Alkalispirochaeta americana]|uniref:Isoprenyl transferase n=1 Tax=Alkalispirochaeta americana TaxID=159291 RepID=A0A1N6PST2_9SPIO|nr:polyprenyl diphosphate synthase [Alkalispirochaeta americana]SIQ07410.1 undecaprenyl diphosphate synthase [Alkalispirochaeta americana]